jgi:hypothetical protein
VVFVGKTPPKARYFAFTPHLATRNDGTKTIDAFASLSETLNDDVIAVEGNGPFEASTVVVASLDHGVDAQVRAALAAAGHPETAINSLVFDPTVAHPGLDATGDTFGRAAFGAGDPNCLEVATTDCPSGIPVGGKMSIAFRVYLEPTSHTAADPTTLVGDRVMHFTK